MWVRGLSIQNGSIEAGDVLCQGTEMAHMGLEIICSLASDTNLILTPRFERSRLLCNLGQEPKALFFTLAVFYHLRKSVDFGCYRRHGSGKDGIEFPKVRKIA